MGLEQLVTVVAIHDHRGPYGLLRHAEQATCSAESAALLEHLGFARIVTRADKLKG